MTTQCIQVKLELGHKATIRTQQTNEGFTHDWTVFVRGPEGSNIQHFVERVVFHLHDSFPKPKRVVKEPPYQVIESGYAGFTLPIEVFFKSKEEPKKVQFQYDLFLHLEGPPINHIRCEKLTFQNPTEEFRRKLLRAGGGLHESAKSDVYIGGLLGKSTSSSSFQEVCTDSTSSTSVKSTTTSRHSSKHDSNIGASDGTGSVINQSSHRTSSAAASLHSETFAHTTTTSSSSLNSKTKAPPADVLPAKSIRPTIPSKESNRAAVAQSAGPPQSFVALFGPPIKTGKPSPDSQRLKDGHHQKAASKTPKLSQPVQPSCTTTTTGTQLQQPVGKDTKNNVKEAKPGHQLMVPGKDVARTKMKRSPSPAVHHNAHASEGDVAGGGVKKRKRSTSSTSSNQTKVKSEKVVKEKTPVPVVVKDEKVKIKKEKVVKEKDKEKEKEFKEKKERHKTMVVDEDNKLKVAKKSEAGEKKHSADRPIVASGKLTVKKEEVKRESSPVVNSAPTLTTTSRPSKGKKRKPSQHPPPAPPAPLPPPQPQPLPAPPPLLQRTPSPSTNSLTAPEDTEPGDCSPGSSISMSSMLHHDGSKGPLQRMMAEMDDDDDIDRVLSPFSTGSESSTPHPPPPTIFQRLKETSNPPPSLPPPPPNPPPTQHQPILPPPTPPHSQPQTPQHAQRVSSMPPPSTVIPCEPTVKHRSNVHRKEKKVRDRDRDREKSSGGKVHKSSSSSSCSSASGDPPKGKTKAVVGATELPSGVTEECIEELRELQTRISALKDRTRLQQIVNVIEETGLYKVTSTTFDFDLCTLDIDTVRKLQTCLSSV